MLVGMQRGDSEDQMSEAQMKVVIGTIELMGPQTHPLRGSTRTANGITGNI